jgi:hypothetical protein
MSDEKYPRLSEDNFDSGEFYQFLKNALIGRRIVKLDSRYIELDNGYTIKIRPNWGCDCGNGSAEIEADYVDKPLDAAVMNVKYEEIEDYDQRHHTGFKIFIYMKNEVINIEGTDAYEEYEDYYGSGFWLDAEMPEHRAQREAKEAERKAKHAEAMKHPKKLPGAMGYMASSPIIRPKKKVKPGNNLKWKI